MALIMQQVLRRVQGLVHKELYPGLPNPQEDVAALYATVMSLKQGYEQLTRGRGDKGRSALLVEELDIVLEELQVVMDTRYLQSEVADGAIETLEGVAEVVADLQDHVADSRIHFEDAPNNNLYVRKKGSWRRYTATTWDDLIQDTETVLNKTWSSLKITEALDLKLDRIQNTPVIYSDYTVPAGHRAVVVCNNTAAITVTLSALEVGAHISVLRANTGAVTVAGAGSDLILDEPSQPLPLQYDSADLIGTQLGWFLK